MEAELKSLKHKSDDQRIKIKQLEKSNANLVQQIKEESEAVKKKYDQLDQMIRGLQNVNLTLRNQVKQFESIPSLKELKEENQAYDISLRNNADKITQLQEENKAYDISLTSNTKEIERLRSQLQECKKILKDCLDMSNNEGFCDETKIKQTLSKL